MRGVDAQQDGTFSYVALQERVPAEHPLRAMRVLLDDALASISRDFDQVYAAGGSDVDPAGAADRGQGGAQAAAECLQGEDRHTPIRFNRTIETQMCPDSSLDRLEGRD